jgi:aspartyl-tRNA(Asn)/glutamyl-tRNA(Gln) amidotransferase subunit B
METEGVTVSQRSKEEAHDYRYFPEPDLPPITLTREKVAEIQAKLPELPDAKIQRFETQYGLTRYEAALLTETMARGDYFERAVAPAATANDETRKRFAKKTANWMVNDFQQLLSAAGLDIVDARIAPDNLYAMIALVEDGTITGNAAKSVFEEMFRSGKPASQVVKDLGLERMSGESEIAAIVEKVIAAHPKPVEDFRAGKQEAIKFLVGQAMREARGRANPATLTEMLKEKLEARA